MPPIPEKLGEFYLGREVDPETNETTDRPLLYDASDLTTHSVIIGMTGSGKTGLGVSLIEEAALDGVPVLAIDPKGDLGNLMLAFPDLAPGDFEPWVDPQEAQRKGVSTGQLAADTAQLWRDGLAQWGQGPERLRALRDAVEVDVFTPGSSAGVPINVLRSFAAPPEPVRRDADLFGERIEAAVTGLLTLLGRDADPLTSPEHVFLANVLRHQWGQGIDLSLPDLIRAIQDPPIRTIGVLDVDSMFPVRDRTALALALNNVLAAPGFESWLQGVPLDVQELLWTPAGKPRVSVISVAHLSDAERMFFLSLLLNAVVGWTRQQTGTGSLRALLYIDEVFGFMPPTANPPTKKPLLTLLKQARAVGLGVTLATQNPVDLDYKGLSNTGTWFLGRLQTERDKARVMEGLIGATPDARFAERDLDALLSGLGKRVFLLHNVHDKAPALFHTRWAMSYLAGPMTREQIRRVMEGRQVTMTANDTAQAGTGAGATARDPAAPTQNARPHLPQDVPEFFVPTLRTGPEVTYLPYLLGAADVTYLSKTQGVDESRRIVRVLAPRGGAAPPDWRESDELAVDLDRLDHAPLDGASFGTLLDTPTAAGVKTWRGLFETYLRSHVPLTLLRSEAAGLTSTPGETERDFRARVAQGAREARDAAKEKIRSRYAAKVKTLENRLMRAEQAIEREGQQAQQKRIDAAVTVGTAILGGLLGRRSVSSTRVGTAMRSVSRVGKETGDVARARETAEQVEAELAEMQAKLEEELASIDAGPGADEPLTEVAVRPRASDVHVHFVALSWLPYVRADDGRLAPAFG